MSQVPAEAALPVAQIVDRPVGRGHWLLLAAIILLGTILRFFCLDQPALWGDESATWARTAGTFRELLEGNRGDGFVPLHYELYWWLGHTWKLTPWLMRLPCALAGTLMIPAMYFLARQLTKPRVALLAALLTATSAYLLNYSRDAKMYMETWFLLTLHAGCFLWWLRRGGGVPWWSWVASGVAMVGVHSSAWLIVVVDVLALLFGCWSRGWAKGLLYLLLFTVGMAIIGSGPAIYYRYYNDWAEKSGGLAPGAIEAKQTAEGEWHNSGIDWVETNTHDKTGPELVRDSATAYLYSYSRAEEIRIGESVPIPQWILDTAWGTLAGILLVLLLAAIRWPSKTAPLQLTLEHWGRWRGAFWIAAWLVLPTYCFFYCRSVETPDSPLIWLKNAATYIGSHALWAIPAFLLLSWLTIRFRPLRLVLAWLLILSTITLVGWSIKTAHAQWYLSLLNLLDRRALVLALLVAGAALTTASTGQTIGQRLRSILALLFFAAVILLLCHVAWISWDHARKLAAAAGRAHVWKSMWMPRYLGIICPAVTLTLAIAILRLPTWPLRTAVIFCIVGVNLVQYVARVFPGNEPRVDLVARDIGLGYHDASVRVYVRDRFPYGSPGTGSIHDATGKFYLAQYAQGTYSIENARFGPAQAILPFNQYYNPRVIANDVRRRPIVQRLIIWDRQSVSRGDAQALSAELGPHWRLTHENDYVARRHWNWQDMDTYHRHEFVRIEPEPIPMPPTRPAATRKATTQPVVSTAPVSPW